MQTIRETIKNYCKEYVKENDDAKAFLKYYEPDFVEMYQPESVREVCDYISLMQQWISTDASDEHLQFVIDDLYSFYNQNKPY